MHLTIPVWFEVTSFIVLILILVGDLALIMKRPHVPSARESARWISFYVALALVFALLMFLLGDVEKAGEFITGWVTEYSLSIDNLFVFVVIMTRFKVPRSSQQEVLMVGIVVALVLRGVFILVGAQLIANFAWIFYLFGAFLLYTAIHGLFSSEEKESTDNAFVRMLRHRLRISEKYDGFKLHTQLNGRRVLTPLIIVFLALGTTDLLFALDSIPAIFGITTDPFIVFTSNIFALMGLRQLYFLLGHLLDRLAYLSYGIAFILAFIGVKLVFHAMHDNTVPFLNGGRPMLWAPEIGTWTSLIVILAAMAVATLASLLKLRLTGSGPAIATDAEVATDADIATDAEIATDAAVPTDADTRDERER